MTESNAAALSDDKDKTTTAELQQFKGLATLTTAT